MRPGLRRSSWTSLRNREKRPELLPDWTQGKTDTEVPVCTQTGEPILGSRGSPSESKPNPEPGVLGRGHDTPKQHFLCQHQGRRQSEKPLRVSAAHGHLHTHSPLAVARAHLHTALF